ncbi:hydroxypyruvate isomerase family protein [Parabacteroides pacaensis]|uniref:hydroxypyruvate isomerase family protein n=1 Tax=Parabacteroides pacaensis TaxID=2086575 RepID=UPI000D1104A5|nr:TIM barrel protein [Parabacteroides pacaensis]
MERRDFIKKATCGLMVAGIGKGSSEASPSPVSSNKAKFTLKYAPTLSMFKVHAGKDPIDNLKFIADQGFRAAYDLGLINRSPAEQERIANEASRLDLELGQFSLKTAGAVHFVLDNPSCREILKKKMEAGLEVQKRTGIRKGLVVLGNLDPKLSREYQTANVIENLRRCCEIVEKAGLELVLEPLNTLINHPGVFLTRTSQAKMICVAVNHPCCKMVDDFYHQQVTEGNLISHLEMCRDYIGSIHIGDNPGRNEPTTGEINYKYIFQYLYNKGYTDILSCEHGQSKPGKEGELAVIRAYREVDPIV